MENPDYLRVCSPEETLSAVSVEAQAHSCVVARSTRNRYVILPLEQATAQGWPVVAPIRFQAWRPAC